MNSQNHSTHSPFRTQSTTPPTQPQPSSTTTHRHSNQITSSSSNLEDDDDDDDDLDDLDDDDEEEEEIDPLGDTDQLSFLLNRQQSIHPHNIYNDPTHHLTTPQQEPSQSTDQPFSFLPPLPPHTSFISNQKQPPPPPTSSNQSMTTTNKIKSDHQINLVSNSNSNLKHHRSNQQPFYSNPPSNSYPKETNEYPPQPHSNDHRELPDYPIDHHSYPIDQKQYPIDQKQSIPKDHSQSIISHTATTITTDQTHQPQLITQRTHSNQQMPSNPPPTNRSRLDPSSSILSLPNTQSHQTAPNLIQPRRRRVSDGSTGTSLRKDILLSKLAEALTLERNKSNVFQKELQNAEHEIDELASQLDQAKREHYQVLSTLKKEIKLLKKEKDGLILALEAAEGIDQDEADKYLALIDPTQAILMEKEDDNGIEGNEVDDQSLHHPPPRDHPLEHHETVRAQAQKRSAVRARRINEELSKLGPSIDSTTSLPTTEIENRNPMEKREEMELNQKFEIETDQALRGRRVAPTERHRRKLSKTRVESHHHHQTGGFWKRSGSRNREVEEGLNRRHRMNSNPSECYDSGSLQTRHQLLSHQQSGASKIGKLFRKVFPVHGNQDEEESGLNQAYDIGDEYLEEQKRLEALIKEHHQEVGPNRERNQVRNLVGGAGGGGGGQRRRGNSRTR